VSKRIIGNLQKRNIDININGNNALKKNNKNKNVNRNRSKKNRNSNKSRRDVNVSGSFNAIAGGLPLLDDNFLIPGSALFGDLDKEPSSS